MWGNVERGYVDRGKGRSVEPLSPSPQMLAQMAWAVEVMPDELEEVERGDAATVLRQIHRRQQARRQREADELGRDPLAGMNEHFASMSPERRRVEAIRLFELFAYYAAGQDPPGELLGDDTKDDDGRGNDGTRSA